MTRRILFFFIIFFITTIAPSESQANPFIKFFQNQDSSPDNDTIKAAEAMYQKFTEPVSITLSDTGSSDRTIKNPFISKIPQPDRPIPTRDPDDTKFSQYEAPSEPIDTQTTPLPNFKITGLVWNTPRPQAILNNNIVNIGDDIEGWKILEISKTGILVEFSDQTRYLIEP